MDWIDLKTIYIIVHLFGVALGAGGAFVSDVLFIISTKDKILDNSEFRLLSKAGLVVWVGVALLVISGVLIFFTNTAGYLASTKFISKMAIVGVIILNGIAVHGAHLRTMRVIVGQSLNQSAIFRKKSRGLYLSGALSAVSWIFALVLGSLSTVPFSVLHILGVYILAVFCAMMLALYKRKIDLKNS